ncbi:hypothetical protein GCM10027422_39650 [Hymenobacter arcticus]
MRAAIYSNQHLIGFADLQPGDEAMGGVYGEFAPTTKYYNEVQQTVWEFNASPSPDYAKWHALALNAQLENGYFLFPMGGYTIDDAAELPDEPKRIYLAGIAAEILQDFLTTDPPRTFVVEPWEELTIQQKLALETELSRELGNDSGRLAKAAANSPAVAEPRFSALCKLGAMGAPSNILFSIRGGPGFSGHFALVRLTWSGTQEQSQSSPKVVFFNSFAELKLERMYPDRSEWED